MFTNWLFGHTKGKKKGFDYLKKKKFSNVNQLYQSPSKKSSYQWKCTQILKKKKKKIDSFYIFLINPK